MTDFNPNPDPTTTAAAYAKFRALEAKDGKPAGAAAKKPARGKKQTAPKTRGKVVISDSPAWRAAAEGFAGAAAERQRTHDQAPKVTAATRAEGICGVVRLYHAGLVTADNLLLVVGNIIKPE